MLRCAHMELPSALDRAIMRTLCWFAIFEYPLSVFELWKWLWSPGRAYSLEEIEVAVENHAWLAERMERVDGFVAVRQPRGVEEWVRLRRERYVDAARKFGKLKRVAHWFAMLTFVRAVAAANTLAWWHTRPESDIDLFVVARPGTVWSARFWCVLPFALFGARPGQRTLDAFCLSFFSSAEALDLSTLRMQEGDPYLAYWIASLVPVLDKDGACARLLEANPWVRSALPNAWGRDMTHAPQSRVAFGNLFPSRGWFETLIAKFQQKKLPVKIRAMANLDTRVVLSDRWLKFHENDRRREYRERWEALQTEYVA